MNLPRLREPKPDIYTFELFEDVVRATAWAVDIAKRELSVLSSKEGLNLATVCEQLHLHPAAARLVITDHRRSATSTSGISLVRQQPKQPITASELSELVQKTIWKLYQQQRTRASAKMELPDVRLELASARFVDVRLDKHRSRDPIGFVSRTLELWAELTIVPKRLRQDLAALLSAEHSLTIVEAGGRLAGSDAVPASSSGILFAHIGRHQTALYKKKEQAVTYLDTLEWGTSLLERAVCDRLSVSTELSRVLMEQYEARRMSPSARRYFSELLGQELALLLKGLDSASRRSRAERVYISSSQPIPELLRLGSWQKKMNMRVPITPVDKKFIGEKTGYAVNLGLQTNSQFAFDVPALCIIEEYVSKDASKLDELVRQSAQLLNSR